MLALRLEPIELQPVGLKTDVDTPSKRPSVSIGGRSLNPKDRNETLPSPTTATETFET